LKRSQDGKHLFTPPQKKIFKIKKPLFEFQYIVYRKKIIASNKFYCKRSLPFERIKRAARGLKAAESIQEYRETLPQVSLFTFKKYYPHLSCPVKEKGRG